MAKRNDLYSDSLGSVTDFILGSGKPKKPGKVKPPKFDGVDYNDALAGTFANIAMAPAVFVADPLVNSLNSTLGDPALIQLYLDVNAKQELLGLDKNAGRIRVRGSDLNKFLQSPGEYIEKAYKGVQAERKWARNIMLMGGGLEFANTLLWAKKNKLSNTDAARLASSVWDLDKSQYTEQDALGILTENALLKSGTGLSISQIEELNSKILKEGHSLKEGKSSARKLWSSEAVDVHKHLYAPAIFKTESEYKDFLTKNLDRGSRDLLASLAAGTLTDPGSVAAANKLKNSLDSTTTSGWSTISANKTKLDSVVSKHIPDPALRAQFYSNFEQEFLSRNRKTFVFDGNLTNYGIREMFKDNQWLKAGMVTGPDREKYLRSVAAAGVLQRLKPAASYSDPDYAKAMSEAEALRGRIPDAEVNALVNQIKKAHSMHDKRYTNRARGEIESKWRNPRNPTFLQYENPLESKLLLEARLKTEIRDLELNGVPTTDPRMQELLYAMDSIKGPFNPFGSGRGRVANMIAWYRVSKDFSPSGFVPGLFTGATYAAGPWSPGEFDLTVMQRRKKDASGNAIWTSKDGKRNLDVDETGSVFLLPRDNMPATYQGLVNMYYLTPGSLFKTFLWSGEGFYYRAEMKRRSAITRMLKDLNPDSITGASGLLGEFYDSGKFKWDSVDKDYLKLLEALKDAGYTDLYRKYDKIFSSYERTLGRANFFGTPGRIWSNAVKKGVMMPMQSRFASLFKLLSKNEKWVSALNLFGAGKIGIYQLVNTGVKIVLGTVLSSLGPVGTFIGMIISDVIVGTLVKLSKPILDLSVLALMGIIGIFFVIMCTVIAGSFTWANRLKTHAVQPPVAGIEIEPLPGEFPDNPDEVILDPTQDAICPVTAGATCNQGPLGSFSHARMGTYAIDLAPNAGPFRAPTDGVVVSVKASNACPWGPNRGANYGGIVVFRSSDNIYYEVMHVNPTVGTGPVEQGTVIATMARNLRSSGCWTGAHYHIDTCVGSQGACVARSRSARWLNSKTWYNELGCNIRGC